MLRRTVLGVLALAACDTSVHTVELPDAPLISPSCVEATQHSDLEWIEANVFKKSCVFSACHKGRALDAGRLTLEAGKSHAALVDVTSDRYDTWKLVVPGDPVKSYLMVVIDPKVDDKGNPVDPDGFDGPITADVGPMPQNSTLLCKEKRDAIQRWIEAGAPAVGGADAGIDAAPAPDAGVDAALPPDALPDAL
ncbi:MAG: hypothetical protein K8W52_35745 [Deltaproteobacteria bacterium]|nr:hypothetical protein [Deltaproteobacteria bacterium]